MSTVLSLPINGRASELLEILLADRYGNWKFVDRGILESICERIASILEEDWPNIRELNEKIDSREEDYNNILKDLNSTEEKLAQIKAGTAGALSVLRP